MEVILLDRIQNLGNLGDQVRVKPGYARNYLIPHGKAVPATADYRERVEERRREFERLANERLAAARDRARQVEGLTVQISRLVGEEGQMYGSVSPADIAEAVTASGFELAKSEVELPHGPIKETGEHDVALNLHPEVHITIRVSVVAES